MICAVHKAGPSQSASEYYFPGATFTPSQASRDGSPPLQFTFPNCLCYIIWNIFFYIPRAVGQQESNQVHKTVLSIEMSVKSEDRTVLP